MVCSLVPGHTGAAGLIMQERPISERQHAQAPLLEKRIYPPRRRISDGDQVHPGMRLHEGGGPSARSDLACCQRVTAGSGTPLRSDHTQNVPVLSPCRSIEPGAS